MKRVAIIDLGTNTFNLLIASAGGNGSYQMLHSAKLSVKLGEGGINRHIIAPQAYERGILAVGEHMKTASKYKVTDVYAFATSAVRNAHNGAEFIASLKELYAIDVRIISGEEELELVYLGIRQAVNLNSENVLMLDIGGGSNELIIANGKGLLWGKSYDLGISRLLQQFNPADPIAAEEVNQITHFLDKQLTELRQIKEQYGVEMLVGSSGSFDTYRSVLTHQGLILSNGAPSVELPLNLYLNLHNQLLLSSKTDREAMPGMDPMRVDMIVLATIFTRYMVQLFGIKRMAQSSYSLKEGALWRLLNR